LRLRQRELRRLRDEAIERARFADSVDMRLRQFNGGKLFGFERVARLGQ